MIEHTIIPITTCRMDMQRDGHKARECLASYRREIGRSDERGNESSISRLMERQVWTGHADMDTFVSCINGRRARAAVAVGRALNNSRGVISSATVCDSLFVRVCGCSDCPVTTCLARAGRNRLVVHDMPRAHDPQHGDDDEKSGEEPRLFAVIHCM